MWCFFLSRVSRSGGGPEKAWPQVSFRDYLPFPPGFCIPMGDGSGSHMSDLSLSSRRHVLSAWSGRVKLSEQLFRWQSRHKLSLSLRKILEVRFHKQLHDYKELQLASRPGNILGSKFWFHMLVMQSFLKLGSRLSSLDCKEPERNVSAYHATQT